MGFFSDIVGGVTGAIRDLGNAIAPGSGNDLVTAAEIAAMIYAPGFVGNWTATTLFNAGIASSTVLAVASAAQGATTLLALSAIGESAGQQATPVSAAQAQGMLINTASNVAPLPVVYGTRRVGGTRVFTNTSGANNEYLHIIVALCEGEISAISNIYIDDVLSTDAKFTGFLTTYTYVGTDAQTHNTNLTADLPALWGSAYKGSGVAYIYAKLKFDRTAFSGFPTITADVAGRKVYDPRTSTEVFSNNPALCIRDYLTNARYGKGLATTLIDDASIITAANYCDELVSVPVGSQKRYTCDGVINVDSSAYENIKLLLASCRGALVYSGGIYKLVLDAPATAAFTFDEDNITGNWSIATAGRRTRYNRVTASFFDPAQNWQPNFGIQDSTAYRAVDNGLLLEASIDLPFTANLYTAQQLAGLQLKQSRFGLMVSFTAFQIGLRCEVGDVVNITHSTPGWSNKLFRITQITIRDNDEVEVVCSEFDATVYNLDTLTAITATPTLTLPDVFSVPTPSGLVLSSGSSELQVNSDGTITSRIKVVWTPPTNIFATICEIQYQISGVSTWQTFTLTDATQGVSWVWPVKDGTLYGVRIRFVNTAGVQSAWVSTIHTVIGKTAPPGDCSAFTYAVTQQGVVLSWVGATDVDLSGYEVRQGASWAAGAYIGANGSATYLWAPQTAGSYTLWVKAKDTSGNYSTNALSATVVVIAPSAPTLSYSISGVNEYLTWDIPVSGFQIDRYEVRYGTTWAGATFVDTTKATGYTRKADYAGARTYWVAAIDTVGNYGSPASIGVSIAASGAVTGVRADIVDNNVLLYWLAPSTGTLPVASYEVRKGSTWAGGTVVGSNGNSTFTTVFEQQSGTYTYWITAVDSVGNYGTPANTTAFVNQPPDYILRVNINSALSGTLVNAMLTSGSLLMPVNTTETWSQHFSNNGYATPQAQITAGNPLYINPSLTSAGYTEIYDYGSTLPATNIAATLNATTLSGTVTPTCTISYSNTSAAGPWTDGTVGATAVLATNFRWVKVAFTFAATAGANLMRVDGLNIRLSTKQHTDSGTGTISNATTGLAVTFGQSFISADTPIVQPGGTTPLIPVVDYVGGVNPTGFTAYLYTLAGVKTVGSFSWSVRGY